MKSLIPILLMIFFVSLNVFSVEGFSKDEVIGISQETNLNINEDISEANNVILSEKEEGVRIDKEIANELGDTEEVEESLANKYLLNGIAMPEKNQIRKGNIYYLKGAEDLQLENNYFDIPVVYNIRVRKWINYYNKKGRKIFELHIERAGRYAPLIGSILEGNGLPRDLIFLAMAESGFNNLAKSSASAVGPWQFMPATGKMYGLKQDWYVDERKDPVKATVAAANYLAKLYNDFGSWKIAMAAYNAGEGKIGRAIKKYNTTDLWDISKRKYLKSETKNYVPKIMALAIIGKNLKFFGFHDIDFRAPLDFDEISVAAGTDLIKLSEKLNVNLEDVQKLNPELLRWFTPLDVSSYKLRLPPKMSEELKKCCMRKDLIASDFQVFEVKRSQVRISQVARKYRIKDTSVIAQLNKVSGKHIFKRGDKVLLPFRKNHQVISSSNFYSDLFYKSKKKRSFSSRKIHIVKRGESLQSVAVRYKLSIKKLLAVNSSLRNTGKLLVGRKLVVR
ncbi:MAG: transglycosylase SLT domain-containing protein [Bacteriovorax sp.]|nr:transglycosylase SLT domain-containing protein [Bacteriovorax sp.]